MFDPGLDRHEWESELRALEEDLATDPVEALPELDRLITRMLEETGYDITEPVIRDGDEREVVAEFLAANDTTEAVERDAESVSPGDVAAAISGYRAIFDYLVAERSTADADFEP